MITKKALNLDQYKREWIYTNSARDAWSKIIEIYKVNNPQGKILLPSYIGWSSNEGSGIFDSVLQSGLNYDFYGLGLHLDVNLDDLKNKVQQNKNPLVLLVHYFGFVDSKYDEITQWLTSNQIFFVEDCAHAWLTDLIGGVCGRKGAFSFYSLHKLLPVSTGGIMVSNNPNDNSGTEFTPFFQLNYDLLSIYNIRRSNYNYLINLLKNIEGIEIIYKELNEGICPQTLPVIIEKTDRTNLYHKMNEKGFGMVSLYHTMIQQLKDFPSDANTILANKIINFPIHQDVDYKDIEEMVDELKNILNA
ncbi:DegT/DnrJ/EryC1/StrS family aminotransferase [Flavobacterium sp.]|uniref:DegT/DnrJ/EryC1/StrS family aminotransferase n=1 Tax=Flavobacterium sp. TaxID=239 RepID=UPI002EDBA7A4